MKIDLAALKNQGWGFARGGIWFAAGVTVGTGYINGETALTIAGALITLLGGSLTGVANTNGSIAQAFSQIPEVKKVDVTDVKLAEAIKKGDPSTIVAVSPTPTLKEEAANA